MRRDGLFLAVLNCTSPGTTCFCASMGTGPRVEASYDLRLTELGADFLVEAGSSAGAAMLATLPARAPNAAEIAEADGLLAAAVARMGRKLNTHNLPQILRESLEHPHWDHMKTCCIGCANCTMVCPTCFCNNTADYVDVGLRHVARRRVWDSCFSLQFAEVHGGNARSDLKSRYRHWVTHKLSYWVEQYGVFGCVGCGRCLTWCPVGIDITEVAAVVRGEKR
jgi:formate hydrogenlyase subunit 6/NADH:ubiquinone oxidoreductase subunit I